MRDGEAEALMAVIGTGRWVRSNETFETKLKASFRANSVRSKLAKLARVEDTKGVAEQGDRKE